MKKLFLIFTALFLATIGFDAYAGKSIRFAENKSGKTVRITGGKKTIKTLQGLEKVKVGGEYKMTVGEKEQFKNFPIPPDNEPLKIEMLSAAGIPEKTLYLFEIGKSVIATETEPVQGDVFSLEIQGDGLRLIPLEK